MIIGNFNKTENFGSVFKKKGECDAMKREYIGYTRSMDKSDFANSLTRYQIELKLLKDLKQAATNENRVDEIDFVEKKYGELANKFKEFGITPGEI